MEAFNHWLNQIQHNGQGVELYNLVGTLCFVVLVISGIWYVWRQKLSFFKAMPIVVMACVFLIYAQHLMTWYRRDFALESYMGTANVGYAFTLLPLFCWLCAKAFSVSTATVGELVAVTTLSWHVIGRSGCTFSGCCRGVDCPWGVYSVYAGGNTFPVCWLESLIALGVLVFLLVRLFRRERGVPDDGRALPYALLLYGSGRFFSEFLRHHPQEDILFGFLPEFSVHALLMAMVGGILLYSVIRGHRPAVSSATAHTAVSQE